jgi:uncharacterized protein (TIGR02246 family)
MIHRGRYLIIAGAALIGVALFMEGTANPNGRRFFGRRAEVQFVAQPAAQKQPGGKAEDAAKEAVMANVRAFTDAFNKRDVKSIVKLFTEDCVLTEADGTTVRGLKELEAELKDSFDDDPDAKISISVESLQVVSADVIVEEGKTMYYPDGKTLTAETDYQVTHVKKGDRWLMARARSFNRVVLSPYDALRDLEWLVGDWVDESPDSIVNYSYRWDVNKSFLINTFSVRVRDQKVLSGTQRIGRDPLTKQIKAWAFDSEGGYAESLWSEQENGWIMKVSGVRNDGKVVSVTNQITRAGKDRFRFDSVDRMVGDELLPNMSVVAVRRPPAAKK